MTALAEQEELLTEYVQWKVKKGMESKDFSPSAFLVDRAKEDALQKIVAISEAIEDAESVSYADIAASELGTEILQILKGT